MIAAQEGPLRAVGSQRCEVESTYRLYSWRIETLPSVSTVNWFLEKMERERMDMFTLADRNAALKRRAHSVIIAHMFGNIFRLSELKQHQRQERRAYHSFKLHFFALAISTLISQPPVTTKTHIPQNNHSEAARAQHQYGTSHTTTYSEEDRRFLQALHTPSLSRRHLWHS